MYTRHLLKDQNEWHETEKAGVCKTLKFFFDFGQKPFITVIESIQRKLTNSLSMC